MGFKTFENILWADKANEVFNSIRYDFPSSEIASNVLSRRYLLKNNVSGSRKHIGRTFREYTFFFTFENKTKTFEKIFYFLLESSRVFRKFDWFYNTLLEYEMNSLFKRGYREKLLQYAPLEVMVRYLLFRGNNHHIMLIIKKVIKFIKEKSNYLLVLIIKFEAAILLEFIVKISNMAFNVIKFVAIVRW